MDTIILCIRMRRAREARRRRLELYRSRLRKIQLRDHSDPFSTPEDEFREYFRLPKVLARRLIEEVSPFMVQAQRSTAIPPHLKVLCSLQFFANGSYQKPTGKDFDLALSQPSVSRCIEEVVDVINRNLLCRYIQFPNTHKERSAVILKNFTATSLPGVLGYVDGTHVMIRRPPHWEDLYVNRHGSHSINVQIACDSDLFILNVLARFPGESEDSYIWSTSALRGRMEEIFRSGEKCWLLGDSGYPQEPWLHVPLLDSLPNTKERRYTDLHCSARNAVRRCIGVLKGRFLCISRLRTLDYCPTKVGRITNVCAMLHNWCVEAHLPDPEVLLLDDDDNDNGQIDDTDGDSDEEEDADLQEELEEERSLLAEGESVRYQYLIAPCEPGPMNSN